MSGNGAPRQRGARLRGPHGAFAVLAGLAVLLVLGLFAPALAEEPAQLPLAELVQRVQERYDATRDLVADVEQETTMAKIGKTVRARGSVVFKKPGKMRWEMHNATEETIVADGTTLWIYRPEDQQAIRMPFAQAFRSSTPISFLTGVGRIAEDFDVRAGEREGSSFTLVLVPKRGDQGDLGTLRLMVDASNYDIVGAEVVDPLGNTSRLKLANVRRNVGVADDTFRFQPPPGVDVLDAPREP
jgi:outer membrane lipoprotein carrier protein